MRAARLEDYSRLCQVEELQTELSAAAQSQKDLARKELEQEEYKELVSSLRQALGEEVSTRAEVAKLSDEVRVLTADRDKLSRQAKRARSQ
jgi:HSP90 family molecular chaperone